MKDRPMLPDTTARAVRYVQQIASDEGRIISSTPDGKWMIEILYDRNASEEVNVVGHVHQRDTRTVDRIVRVVCWEALNVENPR